MRALGRRPGRPCAGAGSASFKSRQAQKTLAALALAPPEAGPEERRGTVNPAQLGGGSKSWQVWGLSPPRRPAGLSCLGPAGPQQRRPASSLTTSSQKSLKPAPPALDEAWGLGRERRAHLSTCCHLTPRPQQRPEAAQGEISRLRRSQAADQSTRQLRPAPEAPFAAA
jgi:hypothetical protein